MELQGTVKKIFEIQSFPSGFQKREMVILTQEQYPQPISIEFLSEKISLLMAIILSFTDFILLISKYIGACRSIFPVAGFL